MLPGALARHVMRRGRHEHDGVALDQELLEMARHFVTSPDALHCLPPLSPRLNGVVRTELPNTEREETVAQAESLVKTLYTRSREIIIINLVEKRLRLNQRNDLLFEYPNLLLPLFDNIAQRLEGY